MAQLRGSDPWLSLWCSYLLCCFSQKQREQKRTKTLKQLIAVVPKFFLPFCRPAMAELCCGGQVLLNYQNQSTERGKIGVVFWCTGVVNIKNEYLLIQSEHSPRSGAWFVSNSCSFNYFNFNSTNTVELCGLFFLFHVLQTWVNTGCPLWIVFSYYIYHF